MSDTKGSRSVIVEWPGLDHSSKGGREGGETIVNYTDPEALRSGNMAGISPEAESIPTLPRRNRGLVCSANHRQNRASFLQCS